MAKLNKLTQLQVKSASKKMGDGGGLWLMVNNCSKSWSYKYRLFNRDREMGLGIWPDVSLDEARNRATHWRNLKNQGIDPINHRKKEQELKEIEAARHKTFKQCLPAYIEARSSEWKNPKHKQQWENTLVTYAYPVLGDIPVADISTDDVLAVVKPIWLTKTETPSRVRQRISKVLDWAAVMKYRNGENPARWDGHLAELLPAPAKIKKTSNHSAMPYAEIADFMQQLKQRDTNSAKALQLCILTATRTNEVIAATWDEIDLEQAIWKIPAERMKAGKQHEIPLCKQALALLSEMPKQANNPYVFAGGRVGKHLSNMAMLKLLKTDMCFNDYTVHGFRSCFRD